MSSSRAELSKSIDIAITIIGDAPNQERAIEEKKRILEALEAGGLKEKTSLLGYQPHKVMIEEAYKNDPLPITT